MLFPTFNRKNIDSFLALHAEKKFPSYPCAACSIVMDAALFTTSVAWKIMIHWHSFKFRLHALCNVFYSLPRAQPLVLNPSYIITAYAATCSNLMPTQTQAFPLPRKERCSLPVNYREFFAYRLWVLYYCKLTWTISFFLQTSLDAYDTVYKPPLVLRAYHPLRSVCCLYCYDRGTGLSRTLPLPLSPLPPCRIRSFSLLHPPSIMMMLFYVPVFSS